MVAQKTSLLPTIKAHSTQEDIKEIILCPKGHDTSRYNRADGKCGGCHYEKNKRYRATPKGHAKQRAYDKKRAATFARYFYRYRWHLRRRIAEKTARLEREE